jgi:ribosome maturation factor RimP
VTVSPGRTPGITLDDCSAVSHQLSGVLDVEDPIAGHYDLEVSSPGLDRPLFTAEQFQRFRGQRVRLKLGVKLEGRRKLEGQIAGLKQDRLLLEAEGETREIPLSTIDSARLVPEF